MSPDHDPNQADVDGDIEQVLRDAEEAVDKVRGGARANPEGAGPDTDEFDGAYDDGEGDSDLAAELEQAQAELAATRDKWLRAVADLDNYKKRVKRDIDDANLRAVQNLLSSFLPIGDNLDRALSVAPPDTNEQLLKGLQMVQQ